MKNILYLIIVIIIVLTGCSESIKIIDIEAESSVTPASVNEIIISPMKNKEETALPTAVITETPKQMATSAPII